ncbi:MAG: hypothetical protein HY721_07280, partial [Planctomycetes bacterium]|nr:hypothetical protein [Planctomycetota bacterium]
VLEGDAKERRTKALELAREAERALEAGDEGAAADLAGKALAAEPVLEAFLVLAESRLAAGEPEGAAKALEHLLELAPGGAEAPAAAKDKLEGLRELAAGLASLEQGAGGGGEKPLAAAETALSAAAKRPDPRLATRARLGLLRLHALKGDVQKALEAAQPLEKDARSWVLLDETRAYLDLGRRAAAKDAKAKAYGAARRRGQALARLKGVPDAHRREGNYLLGAAQVELGDLEKSDAAYREALKCFAAAEEAGLKTAELYESWAAAYDRLGNLIRAASLYRSAYEIRPSPERCLRAAELYLNANPSSPEALEILRRGADLYADSVEIRKKLEELSR